MTLLYRLVMGYWVFSFRFLAFSARPPPQSLVRPRADVKSNSDAQVHPQNTMHGQTGHIAAKTENRLEFAALVAGSLYITPGFCRGWGDARLFLRSRTVFPTGL
mgnify:CR=1 FL=1